ncbi:Sec-independent protein translocase protein TatB [Rhodocyclaceae bacterium SMB388]
MFDFGFTELMLVALVALIVVGPERLPKVARTAGHLLGRLQRYVSDVKSDITREMQLEDLKKLQKQVEEQARDLETSVRSQMSKVEGDIGKTAAGLEKDLAIGQHNTSPVRPASGAVTGALAHDSSPPMPDTHGKSLDASGGGPQDATDAGGGGPQLELGLDASAKRKQTVDRS